MAMYNAINEPAKTRPCWVHGRRGIFHRWTDTARPAHARGEENDPEAKYYQLYSVHALVEYEDGTMARVWPADLQFADGGEFAAYDWESMEEKRDALPFTTEVKTGPETADAWHQPPAAYIKNTPQPLRSCVNCGYDNPYKDMCLDADYICRKCDAKKCRCRDCEGGSQWIPQGGANE